VTDAQLAAALLAIDPTGLGGVLLRAAPGPARDDWLKGLAAGLGRTPHKLPLGIDDARLLGGLDLVATLQAGRPVSSPGVLAEHDGEVLLVAMAERLAPSTAARLAAVLDTGQTPDGRAARLGLVALDEGVDDDEALPSALAERLAIHLRLDGRAGAPAPGGLDVPALRARWADIGPDEDILQALCATAVALGITSMRAPLLAWRAARALAALNGHARVEASDAQTAARLVLAPRARVLPTSDAPEQDEPPPPPPPPPEDGEPPPEGEDDSPGDAPLAEQVLEAARTALPAGLLLALAAGVASPRQSGAGGRAGSAARSRRRGRPIGSVRGDPRGDTRLDVLASLRAAAPWQAVRRRDGSAATGGLHWRRDDFRVRRFSERRATTTVFAVDASGSAALHRLAEAKGAVELLLADCYVRRDRVALLAFRGNTCELLLPPTHSLPRVRRSLAALPGGGGTPLASGIVAAHALAASLLRQGESPAVVFLTDGRANVSRDGRPGREAAREDALKAARAFATAGISTLLLDTSPQPQAAAREVALAMGARYLALPHADSARLSQAVSVALRS
jgi:magnesium chelatase subunit D